jgi:hypothetical protein
MRKAPQGTFKSFWQGNGLNSSPLKKQRSSQKQKMCLSILELVARGFPRSSGPRALLFSLFTARIRSTTAYPPPLLSHALEALVSLIFLPTTGCLFLLLHCRCATFYRPSTTLVVISCRIPQGSDVNLQIFLDLWHMQPVLQGPDISFYTCFRRSIRSIKWR